MRIPLMALAGLAIAGPATAEATLSIPLALGDMGSVQSQAYTCADGQAFTVQYVNAGANSLALLTLDGEERIFVNVISASGARYASGAHVWWTKGDTASLENQMSDAPMLTCTAE